MLVPAVSAFGGAAARAGVGDSYWMAWQQWFLGDALAQLVVTPAILWWLTRGVKDMKALTAAHKIEAGLCIGVFTVTGYLASHTGEASIFLAEPRFYAPIILLFWIAIRFGMAGTTVAVTVLAFLFVEAATEGRGPFSSGTPTDVAMALQSFLIPRVIALYLVGLAIEQSSRAQNLLRESEARFRTAANCAPIMIWMSGLDKGCDFFNDGWLTFTGRPLEAELGNGWAEGVHRDDLTRCLEVYHSAFDNRRTFQMEYRLRGRDGQYHWILDFGVPRYASNGNFVGYIGSAIDVTAHKRTEELHDVLAHLQRVSVLGELSIAIAHEVKQPLNAMLMNASAAEQLLSLENPPLSEFAEIISEIRNEIVRTHEVVRRTHALARREKSIMERLDINATAASVLHLISSEAARQSIRLRTDLGAEMPLVLGNQAQLQQVLLNLINNAMEAMANTHRTARELILQTRSKEDGFVEVLVIDRGCGVASDQLPRLFESFFTTKDRGLGLGLSISRTIAEAHGGKIWVENNSAAGVTAHFMLPVDTIGRLA